MLLLRSLRACSLGVVLVKVAGNYHMYPTPADAELLSQLFSVWPDPLFGNGCCTTYYITSSSL